MRNMSKMSCSIIVWGIVAALFSGCEDYREIEFPAAKVYATAKMQPWSVSSEKDIPVTLYVCRDGKCMKFDTETTPEDTKTFLKDIGLHYEEHPCTDTLYEFGGKYEDHRIDAEGLGFYYDHGKLWQYHLSTKHLSTERSARWVEGLRVGTSPDKLFALPLKFEDVKKMYGNDYKIHKRVYK